MHPDPGLQCIAHRSAHMYLPGMRPIRLHRGNQEPPRERYATRRPAEDASCVVASEVSIQFNGGPVAKRRSTGLGIQETL